MPDERKARIVLEGMDFYELEKYIASQRATIADLTRKLAELRALCGRAADEITTAWNRQAFNAGERERLVQELEANSSEATKPAEGEPLVLPPDPNYGKDCPVGMVQVEFVGCPPSARIHDYGWKPVEHAFLEVYVDGQRFRIEVGNVTRIDGTKRRGLTVIGPCHWDVDHCAINAVDLMLDALTAARIPGKEGE